LERVCFQIADLKPLASTRRTVTQHSSATLDWLVLKCSRLAGFEVFPEDQDGYEDVLTIVDPQCGTFPLPTFLRDRAAYKATRD